jgi:hypothetical protein
MFYCSDVMIIIYCRGERAPCSTLSSSVLSLSLSLSLFFCFYLFLSVCLYLSLSVFISLSLCRYLSLYLYLCLSVFISLSLCLSLSLSPSVCFYLSLPLSSLYLSPSVCLSLYNQIYSPIASFPLCSHFLPTVRIHLNLTIRCLTPDSCLTCVAYGTVPYCTVQYLHQSYRLRFDSHNIATSTDTASIS